jgi:uncharacterized membrane protein HdeD (DUF308 family)
MKCNIDARGKKARLLWGIAAMVIGLVLAVLAAVGVLTGVLPWVVGGVLLAMGAFSIYEARAGWCAVRAMGFKTPM